MKILISGGCKNGKSSLAEACACALSGDGPMYYLATMIPHDDEDEERIRRHVASRAGKGFQTIEQGRNILECMKKTGTQGTFLLDAVTSLLSNEMFHDQIIDLEAGERLASQLVELAEKTEHIVFVSDYIYGDAPEYDSYTEAYRQGLALCDRKLAACCDTVVEVCTGHYMVYKGNLPI